MPATDLLWIVLIGTTVILGFIGFFIAMVVLNQRKVIASQREKLAESKRVRDLLQEIPRQILAAQESERARVARDLHDGINQMLASIKYRLHTTKASSTGFPEEAFERLIDDLERTMEEVKRLSHNLHPKALDDLGFHAAVRNFCDEFASRTGIRVSAELDSIPEDLEDDVKIGIFRIIQESFQNIEKYAHATEVNITVDEVAGMVSTFRMQIADNGKGFEAGNLKPGSGGGHQGLGTTTMHERANLLGGTLEIQSTPGKGTRTTIIFPLKR